MTNSETGFDSARGDDGTTSFNVVIVGIRNDVPHSKAVSELAALFRQSEQQIVQLISSTPRVVKTACAWEVATKYQVAIERTGCVCQVVPADVKLPSGTPAQSVNAPVRAQAAQGLVPNSEGSGNLDRARSIFVGTGYSHYQPVWERAAREPGKTSWNWAALVFGMFWMAYRKMYAYTVAYAAALLVVSVVLEVMQVNSKLQSILFLSTNIMVGLFGDMLYGRFVTSHVARIVATTPGDRIDIELTRQGGTSFAGLVAVGGGAFITAWFLLVLLLG